APLCQRRRRFGAISGLNLWKIRPPRGIPKVIPPDTSGEPVNARWSSGPAHLALIFVQGIKHVAD
ncbi:MAG TPA: hypothetical protein VFC46_08955, partial [Humisphaera sp.]|nr:hypothetical protein [Humisphaera sp.]